MKRLLSYVVVIRPLVMRAVAKSETLALSMELKGFGSNTYKNMPREAAGSRRFYRAGAGRGTEHLSVLEMMPG